MGQSLGIGAATPPTHPQTTAKTETPVPVLSQEIRNANLVQGLVSFITLSPGKASTEPEFGDTAPRIGKLQGQASQHLVFQGILHKWF